jgi:hypothetical protein
VVGQDGEKPDGDFEGLVQEALRSQPDDPRAFMSNVAIVVEDEPPPGRPLPKLYQASL